MSFLDGLAVDEGLRTDQLSGSLRDEKARSNDLDAAILDMESTLSQFRDLVGSLQRYASTASLWRMLTYSEIDDMRLQQSAQETETATSSKDAQTLMNLEMKLQSTANKAQSKTIEMELKRLEATQLAEHMKIVTVCGGLWNPTSGADPRHTCRNDISTRKPIRQRCCFSSAESAQRSTCSPTQSLLSIRFPLLCKWQRPRRLWAYVSSEASSGTS